MFIYGSDHHPHNADFDSLASMLAAKKLYPDAVLVFSGSQERSLRDFFIHSALYAFEMERMKNIDLQESETVDSGRHPSDQPDRKVFRDRAKARN